MFRRAFWFGAGAASALWVQHKVRRAAQRFTPPAIAASAAEAARARGRDVAAAIAEGRQAMRAREAELRAELQPEPEREGPVASVHPFTPRAASAGEWEGPDGPRPDRRRAERRRIQARPADG